MNTKRYKKANLNLGSQNLVEYCPFEMGLTYSTTHAICFKKFELNQSFMNSYVNFKRY